MITEPLLRAILAGIEEGIHVVDTRGVTVFYNAAAAENDGLRPDEVIGRHVLEVFPSLTEQTSTLLKVLATRQPITDQQQTFTNFKGNRVTTVNSTYPVLIGGQLAGGLEVSKNITRVQELAEAVWDLRTALLQKQPGRSRAAGGALYTFADLVGEDPRFRAVVEQAARAARGASPILVGGETGTGKELLVHAIHQSSPRAGRPFIAQNCAALPEGLLEGILFGTARGGFTGAEDRPGLFELADGGTLLLDEINSMPLSLQAKLLRVLQDGRVRRLGEARERTVDVRVIAATNVDPMWAVEQGRLRRDLFHRINVVYLELPPLRERRDDIPLLCRHFIQKHRHQAGASAAELAPEVAEFFLRYAWPGNVRELEHAVEGALALARGPRLGPEDLPAHLQRAYAEPAAAGTAARAEAPGEVAGTAAEPAWTDGSAPPPAAGLRQSLQATERETIRQALAAHGWNMARTARALGLPRQTLQYRVRILGLGRPDRPPAGGEGAP